MIRLPLKTMRVKSPHFAEGVLINQNMFDPDKHVKMEATKSIRKPKKPVERKEEFNV